MTDRLSRRRVVTGLAAAGLTAVAGCAGPGGDGENETTPVEEETPIEEETPMEETPMETPTEETPMEETPMETPTEETPMAETTTANETEGI